MQSSDTATSVQVKQTNKPCFFNFGEDLSYFVILRYKSRDFIKMYDDYVNHPIKGDFQKTLLLSHIGRKSFVEYKMALATYNT